MKKLVGLTVLLMIYGCVVRPQVTLYPLSNNDFCVKGEQSCNMCNMDIGMSDYYFNKVLELKRE